jgi:hypothetical protein
VSVKANGEFEATLSCQINAIFYQSPVPLPLAKQKEMLAYMISYTAYNMASGFNVRSQWKLVVKCVRYFFFFLNSPEGRFFFVNLIIFPLMLQVIKTL